MINHLLPEQFKIHVLDDDQDSLYEIEKLLKENNINNISYFRKTDAFIQSINDAQCCIIDYRLDGAMNGIDVVKKVKEVIPHCFFIMLSGYKDFDVIYKFDHLVQSGHYILKGTEDTNELIIKSLKERLGFLKMIADVFINSQSWKEQIEELKALITNIKN